MTSKLERIASHCKSSVHVTANDHTTGYETVESFFKNPRPNGDTFDDVYSLVDSQHDIAQRCIATDEIWEVQAYDRTPIGSFTTIGATLDEALDVMLVVLGLEKEV